MGLTVCEKANKWSLSSNRFVFTFKAEDKKNKAALKKHTQVPVSVHVSHTLMQTVTVVRCNDAHFVLEN